MMICSVAKFLKVMKRKEEDLDTASSRHERKEKHIQSNVRKYTGKKPLGTGRCGSDDYVKMAPNGREWDSVNLINLAKNRYQLRAFVNKDP